MLKKYCEYCGEHQETSHDDAYESHVAYHEDEQEIDNFLKHFASLMSEDEDEDEDEEEEYVAHTSSAYRLEKIASITRRIDRVADVLEKSGDKKLAFELDKVSDMLDTYRQEKGV